MTDRRNPPYLTGRQQAVGNHRHQVPAENHSSPRGTARLGNEPFSRLRLSDVTPVGNDAGAAVVLILRGERPARAVDAALGSRDAFDNIPPFGLFGETLVASGRLPAPLCVWFGQQLLLKMVRRLRIAFRRLTRTVDVVGVAWSRALSRKWRIRRAMHPALRAIARKPALQLDAAARVPAIDRPVLAVWARDDRVIPTAQVHCLAELLPYAHYEGDAHSPTLTQLDQPDRLADLLRASVANLHRAGTRTSNSDLHRADGTHDMVDALADDAEPAISLASGAARTSGSRATDQDSRVA